MVLPTTIATVASALTIIDLTIKFAGFMSPEVQRSLRYGREEIEKLNPSSIESANDIFNRTLQSRVPTNLVKTTSQDLSILFSIVELFERNIQPKYQERIPRYGAGLSVVLGHVDMNLYEWGCFSAWGRLINLSSEIPPEQSEKSVHFLPATKTEKGLSRCKPIINLLPQEYKKSKLYFVSPISHPARLTLTREIRDGQNLKRLDLRFGKYPQPNTEEESQYLYHLNIHDSTNAFFYGFGDDKSSIIIKYLLTYNDVTNLITGLLADLIEYSRRARGEEYISQSLINNLKNRFKPD